MKKSNNKFAAGFLLGVLSMTVVLMCVFIGMFIAQRENRNSTITGKTEAKLEKLKSMIDYYYLDKVNVDDLESGVYKGLLSGLNDPYSVYYTPEECEQMMEETSGNYVGIGVLIGQDSTTGTVKIIRCFDESPAKKAGMLEGDILCEIDGKDVTGEDANEIVSLIKNAANQKIKITVYRSEINEYKELEVEKRNITVPTVEYKMLDKEKGIGYVQIVQFDEVTFNQYREAIESLKEQGMKSVIFDIRDNPGGLYDVVCKILDQILPTGTMVYTEDKHGKREEQISDANFLDMPIVVIQNGNSASASEIFAGAIQDFSAGEIIGTQSFGKGIVQQIFTLRDGSAIKLTIQKYFTPKGVNIHGKGITPDVEIRDDYETEADEPLEKAVRILNGESDSEETTAEQTTENNKNSQVGEETSTDKNSKSSEQTTSSKNSKSSKKEVKKKKKGKKSKKTKKR